jgi:hypothetical protein
MEILITKAQLTSKGFVNATYIDEQNREVNIKGIVEAHNDLRDALAALVPYMAELTEQREANYINWGALYGPENNELLRKMDVTGVIKGYSASGVPTATLLGKRCLASNNIIEIKTPAQAISTGDTYWAMTEEFANAVKVFFDEVYKYLFEQKYKTAQTQIDFDDLEDLFVPTPTEDAGSLDSES